MVLETGSIHHMDIRDGLYETHVRMSDLEAGMASYGETVGLELGTEVDSK